MLTQTNKKYLPCDEMGIHPRFTDFKVDSLFISSYRIFSALTPPESFCATETSSFEVCFSSSFTLSLCNRYAIQLAYCNGCACATLACSSVSAGLLAFDFLYYHAYKEGCKPTQWIRQSVLPIAPIFAC